MPDNGFGSKANSRSFILRLYRVRPRWDQGTVQIMDAITLRDPDGKVPFPIVNENTAERILTGGDFDVESVRRTPDGTLWFGEEFGPFIVHASVDGVVLDAPVPLPRVFSPDNPFLLGRTPNLNSSNGFEGMALSVDGKTLYPFLEGPLVGDDPLVRHVYEFDISQRRYTGRTWSYRMKVTGTLVSDAVALDHDQLIVTESDNNQGAAAAWKKAFLVDAPDRKPVLAKRELVDLLDIGDPDKLSLRGGRLRARRSVQVSLPDGRGGAAARPRQARVRQRHQLRLDRPQPVAARLQRLHPREGAALTDALADLRVAPV
jgi:hypothetical protein